MPAGTVQFAATASSTAPTVSGFISEGVPPPRKIDVTSRGPVRSRIDFSSVAKASANRSWSTGWWRTWLLKSQ
jgi:hypothetical protein